MAYLLLKMDCRIASSAAKIPPDGAVVALLSGTVTMDLAAARTASTRAVHPFPYLDQVGSVRSHAKRASQARSITSTARACLDAASVWGPIFPSAVTPSAD